MVGCKFGQLRLVLSEYGLPSHLKPYKDNPRLPGEGYRVPAWGETAEQDHERYVGDGKWVKSCYGYRSFENYWDEDYRLPASVLPPDWDEMTREDAPAKTSQAQTSPGPQPQDDVQAIKARVQELEGDYQMMQGSLLSILGELDCEEPASALLKLKVLKEEKNASFEATKKYASEVQEIAELLGHPLSPFYRVKQRLEAVLKEAAASTPTLRPIAEMPSEVPEGCVRVLASNANPNQRWLFNHEKTVWCRHFLDIRIPAPPDPGAELRQEFEAWAIKTFGWHPDKFTLKESSGEYLDDMARPAFQAFKAGRAKEGAR